MIANKGADDHRVPLTGREQAQYRVFIETAIDGRQNGECLNTVEQVSIAHIIHFVVFEYLGLTKHIAEVA